MIFEDDQARFADAPLSHSEQSAHLFLFQLRFFENGAFHPGFIGDGASLPGEKLGRFGVARFVDQIAGEVDASADSPGDQRPLPGFLDLIFLFDQKNQLFHGRREFVGGLGAIAQESIAGKQNGFNHVLDESLHG